MLTVKDFLPLWSLTKSGFLFHRAGSSPRCPSPRRRVSQRMTSAPNSHSTRATVGPAAPVVNSTTRIPSNGSFDMVCLSLQKFYRELMEFWNIGLVRTPFFHCSIVPFFWLYDALCSQGHEIVFAQSQLAAIHFFVVLPDQRRGSCHATRRRAQPRHWTEV